MPKALFDAVIGAPYPTDEADVAYVLFPALGLVQGGFTDPLPAALTLTGDEAATVQDTLDGYNAAITDLADQIGFTVADVAAMLAGLDAPARTHFVFLVGEGLTVEQAAATTAWSLDGLHPNNGGYSLVANVFIEAINTELGLDGDEALDPVARRTWDPTHPAR